MKKTVVLILILLVLTSFLSSCVSEEKVDNHIIDMTSDLITYNWNLNNLNITFDEFENHVSEYFVDEDAFLNHIRDYELSPLILEDVENITSEVVEKSKGQNNYDLPIVKISKVYDISSDTKCVYVKLVISPINRVQGSIPYISKSSNMNQERNVKIEFVKSNRRWKVSLIQANTFLVELKDKLSDEFVNKYAYHSNSPVEYIREFELTS